jgi:Type IV secretion system pilin
MSLLALFNVGSAAADGLSLSSHVPVGTVSSYNTFVGDACGALSQDVSSDGCLKGPDTFKSVARTVVNVLSIIIGIVAVIMILISGFRFIIAGSDTNAVNSAKNTLIYSIVGLIIAILAQFLVHDVLNTATTIQNSSYLNDNSYIKRDG